MEIFWRLVFAHFLGDFTFQTNYVARWKRESNWGMFFHVTHHPILYFIIAYPFLMQPWIQTPYFAINGVGAILLIYVLHWLEDKWRVWTVGKAAAADNTFYFFWDQFIHLLTLFAFTPRISGDVLPPSWLSLAILLALATHFTNILAYFLVKDIYGNGHASVLLRHKYLFMLERLVVVVCLCLPGKWPMVLLIAFVLQFLRRRHGTNPDSSWINIVVGNGMAIVLGVLGRLVLFS